MAHESARTPSSAAWPDKLITQAEAFAMAADWPVRVDWITTPVLEVVLLCGKCARSTGQLLREKTPYNGSLDQMLSMVLRHMVMAHDVPLNTRAPAAADPAPRIPGPGVTPEQLEQSWGARHGS